MKLTIAVATAGIAFLTLGATGGPAQTSNGIDPEALIDRILAVEQAQRDMVQTITMLATFREGEIKDDEFREKERYDIKISMKVLPDTTWYHEEYLAYYKDGVKQSKDDLRKAEKKRREEKKKRKSFDISYRMIRPFLPENRELFDIRYDGVTPEILEGYMCHQFTVTAKEEDDRLINGTYYFEADEFNLVRVDFTPAKLVKKMMFRLKKLDMSVVYHPADNGVWVPKRFEIEGEGKAALFIGVSFAGDVTFTDPKFNKSLDDDLFLGEADDG